MANNNTDKTGTRSLLRFLIFPRKQLKYAYFHFLTVTLSILVIISFSYYKFMELLDSTTNNASQYLLSEYIYFISIISLITIALMGSISFALVIVFLHRFVGPLKPLLKHLDCILNGDYSHRTHLRTEDEINELALKLNIVSENLARKEEERNRAV